MALIPALKAGLSKTENDLVNPFFHFKANSSHLNEIFWWETIFFHGHKLTVDIVR